MTSAFVDSQRVASLLVWIAFALAFTTAAAVVMERAAVALGQLWRRRLEHRYVPLVERALAGDEWHDVPSSRAHRATASSLQSC